MENLQVIVDLSDSTTQDEVIKKFVNTLKLTPMTLPNWDGFYDYLRSLHTESDLVKQKQPKAVHLILKNVINFENSSRELGTGDYNTFLGLLADSTDKNQRHDKIIFTFEIDNG